MAFASPVTTVIPSGDRLAGDPATLAIPAAIPAAITAHPATISQQDLAYGSGFTKFYDSLFDAQVALGAQAWFVLSYLARHTLRRHIAELHRSTHRIAKDLGIARNTCATAIARLKLAGIIVVDDEDSGRTDVRPIRILPPAYWTLDALTSEAGDRGTQREQRTPAATPTATGPEIVPTVAGDPATETGADATSSNFELVSAIAALDAIEASANFELASRKTSSISEPAFIGSIKGDLKGYVPNADALEPTSASPLDHQPDTANDTANDTQVSPSGAVSGTQAAPTGSLGERWPEREDGEAEGHYYRRAILTEQARNKQIAMLVGLMRDKLAISPTDFPTRKQDFPRMGRLLAQHGVAKIVRGILTISLDEILGEPLDLLTRWLNTTGPNRQANRQAGRSGRRPSAPAPSDAVSDLLAETLGSSGSSSDTDRAVRDLLEDTYHG